MITNVPDNQLSQLSEFVSSSMCLHFPRERWGDLERGICSATEELGFKDAESCIQWLVDSPLTRKQIEMLAGYLTIGETYFFRERKSFEVLENNILPELICSRRREEQYIRIWSAGCSTGEEPYSIAMLLNKAIPDLKDWNITIIATDINPRFLHKASQGIYSEWSFRDAPAWIRQYFKKTRNGLEILPFIKKMVSFSYHNLAEDTYPSLLNNTNAIDIIFCRNVLMYFSPLRTGQVIKNLYSCLVEKGWLIVSPVETSHLLFSQFATVNFPDVIAYRKDSYKPQKYEEFIPVHFAPEPLMVVPTEESGESKVKDKEIEKPDTYEEALVLYEKGKYEEVVKKIVNMVSSNQDNSKDIMLLARAYANQGNLTEALEWCEKAMARDRLNPYCHYLHATILQERGQIDEAVSSLKRALYLDQNFVLAHFGLGNLSKLQGKFRESEKSFENALSLLSRLEQNEILPESEGVTAGRLSEIITSIKGREEPE